MRRTENTIFLAPLGSSAEKASLANFCGPAMRRFPEGTHGRGCGSAVDSNRLKKPGCGCCRRRGTAVSRGRSLARLTQHRFGLTAMKSQPPPPARSRCDPPRGSDQ